MLLWVRLSTGSPRMKKAATVAKTHLDDVLGNLYVDVAADDNDDEAVGDDVFVDLKKGLNMPAVLMLTKTWMIHKFRFWRFSIPPYKAFEKCQQRGTPQMTHSISSIPVWGRFPTNLEMQLDGLKTMTVQVNQAVLLMIGFGHPDWPYISSWKHVPGTMLTNKTPKKKDVSRTWCYWCDTDSWNPLVNGYIAMENHHF